MAFLKPDPPSPPDPAATAGAQTQSNIQTALANARLNRVNQTTPWGSINYTQGPVDANGVPTYSSAITLDPAQQQLLDQQRSQQLTRGNIASNLLGQVGNRLGQPLDLSHLHGVYDRYAPQGGSGSPPGPGGMALGTGMQPNPAARGPNGTGIPGVAPGNSTPGAAMQPPMPTPQGNPLMTGGADPNALRAQLAQLLRGAQ